MNIKDKLILFFSIITWLYLLVAVPESYAFGMAVTGLQYSIVLGVCILLGGAVSYGLLLKDAKRSLPDKRLCLLGTLSVLILFWMVLSMWYSGGSATKIIVNLYQSGVPGFLIALVAYQYPQSRKLFISAVIIHLTIVLLMGFRIQGPWLILDNVIRDTTQLTQSLFDVVSAGSVSKYSAQFANPVQCGFLGVFGILLGVHLVFYKNGLVRLLGFIPLVLGLAGAVIAVQRALWLCVPLAILFGFYKKCFSALLLAMSILLAIFILSDLGMFFLSTSSDLGNYFTLMFDSDQQSYRLNMFSKALDMMLINPIMGVGDLGRMIHYMGGVPHDTILFNSVLYGLPVGGLNLLLIGIVAVSSLQLLNNRRLNQSVHQFKLLFSGSDRNFSVMIGWLYLLLMFSNGTWSCVFYWICCAIACMPWVFGDLQIIRRN